MKSTFQGDKEKVKIVITPDADLEELQRFVERGFLVAVPHYFGASKRLSCITIESLHSMKEPPHTAKHSE